MPPKRKANQGASLRGRPKRATKDSPPTTIEQSLLKQNKRSKQYLQEFKKKLLNSQDEAQKSLVAARQDLAQPQPASRHDLIAEIRGVLQPMLMPNNRNPVADQVQKILDLGHTMLNAHRTMEKVTRQPHLINIIKGWEQDRKMMEKLLFYGKKEGIRIVDRIIDPYPERTNAQRQSSRGGVQGGREMTAEEEALAFVMYSTLKKDKEAKPAWGVAARKQLEALIQAVNTLPVPPGNEKETK
ncbi:hypothetical protein QBC42DRAFT_326921 [Cladorrhinum samala]|uniref:Uncharacterized protein n=1 Tax=Cladorrhinum samala TaxID=585594 RepID=A0AAV9HNQ4_9PEZI|nr:hypothetical protein QBC42DRAFT_326921 [Cladorrhinum samala]